MFHKTQTTFRCVGFNAPTLGLQMLLLLSLFFPAIAISEEQIRALNVSLVHNEHLSATVETQQLVVEDNSNASFSQCKEIQNNNSYTVIRYAELQFTEFPYLELSYSLDPAAHLATFEFFSGIFLLPDRRWQQLNGIRKCVASLELSYLNEGTEPE